MATAKKKVARPAVRKPAAKKTVARPKDPVVPLKKGEKLAGITLHDGKPHALVLLPGTFGPGKWADAIAWAKKQGGELPNRHDAIVLFDNLKAKFEDRWYWTGIVRPVNAGFAFIQFFGNGNQNGGHKVNVYRARAVRRVAI